MSKANEENIKFVMLITMAGGYMDVYSYLARGNVFATGQTGNFILLAIQLAQGNYSKLPNYLLPIIFFWIGVFGVSYLVNDYFKDNVNYGKAVILIIEIIIFAIIGFLPTYVPNVFITPFISLCAAMQFCSFRKIGSNTTYASVFCTGNMRSCAESLYMGLINKNTKELKTGINYGLILLAFFLGALVGIFAYNSMGVKSIWGVSLILLLAILLLKNDKIVEKIQVVI